MHCSKLVLLTIVPTLSLCILIGCEAKKEGAPATPTSLPSINQSDGESGGQASTSGAPAPNAATEQQVQDFAKKWIAAIEKTDIAAIDTLVNWRKIGERSIETFDLPSKERAEILKGTAMMSHSVGNNLRNLATQGGSYRLVRIAQRGDYYHAIFRLLTPDGSLNYHDLRVISTNTRVEADQFFVAATGEEMADTLRAIFAPIIESKKTILSRLSGAQKQAMSDNKKIQQMGTKLRTGEFQEVVNLYQQLGSDGKKIKSAMLFRIMASAQLDDATHLKSIEEYAKEFPNDPSLAILMMDAAIMEKDFQQLETSRTKINDWTGGDDYIDLAVGAVLADAGKVDEAVELTKDIDPQDIDVMMGYDFKLSIALPAKDHDTVLKNLLVLRDKFGLNLDISESPDFADFLASPQGKQFVGQ